MERKMVESFRPHPLVRSKAEATTSRKNNSKKRFGEQIPVSFPLENDSLSRSIIQFDLVHDEVRARSEEQEDNGDA